MSEHHGGWYYDQQKDIHDLNRLTSISLHANMSTTNGGESWEATGENHGIYDINNILHPEREEVYIANKYALGENELLRAEQRGYYLQPICTSILEEDFNMAVANTFSETGGDAIGDMWNSIRPKIAPYTQFLGDKLQQIADTNRKLKKEGKKTLTLSEALMNVTDFAADKLGKTGDTGGQNLLADYMNRSLVCQGSRFSYFNGTGIAFSNLQCKFTLFPHWTPDGQLNTVSNQLNRLFPYFIGKYVNDEHEILGINLGDFVGWQLPPGGFQPDIKDVDNIQIGTLKLKIGAYYSVSNLVVESCQLNFSKQMVKCPVSFGTSLTDEETAKKEINILNEDTLGESLTIKNDSKNIDEAIQKYETKFLSSESSLSPLYCDVILVLKPATKYTEQSLKQFTGGITMNKEINHLNNFLKDRLSGIRTEVKGKYYDNNDEALKLGVHPSRIEEMQAAEKEKNAKEEEEALNKESEDENKKHLEELIKKGEEDEMDDEAREEQNEINDEIDKYAAEQKANSTFYNIDTSNESLLQDEYILDGLAGSNDAYSDIERIKGNSDYSLNQISGDIPDDSNLNFNKDATASDYNILARN